MKNPISNISVRNCSSLVNWCETVKNQFIITQQTKKGTREIFQSYSTIIAVRDENGQVWLDKNSWNYSTTTSKYRNQFLGVDTKETKKRIASGRYKLANLN